MNEIETTQFKDRQTGFTWTKSFMKRNKLSHKKTEMISSARKSNKANPFTIYDFFDQLVEVGDDPGNTFLHFIIIINLCIYIVLLLAMKISFTV